jgi:hypothetical protein
MVKAARLAFDHDGFAALAKADFTEESRKNDHLHGRCARGARPQPRLIENSFHQRRPALGTLNQPVAHRLV